jgi:hypothetical protein
MEFAKDAKALIASAIALLPPLDASVVGVTTDPTKVTLNINSRGSLSHPIFRRKPNASHMCARIKFTHI